MLRTQRSQSPVYCKLSIIFEKHLQKKALRIDCLKTVTAFSREISFASKQSAQQMKMS